jgi:hypothetical protein
MAGDQFVRVRVSGDREVAARVRILRQTADGAIHDAEEEAAKLVARRVRPKIPLGPGLNGHVRSSVKVVQSGRGTDVQAGGPRFKYYPWLDFGGHVGKKRSVYRRFIREGRYIWPTMQESRPAIQRILERALEDAVRRAGLA